MAGEAKSLEHVDPRERVKAYIENVERVVETLLHRVDGAIRSLVKLARAYADDARYYLEQGRVFDALACIAYAEGLLDALRHLGLASFEWTPTSKLLWRPTVLVAGTFDLIHPGHIHLFREAWRRGRVVAVVARNENVIRFKGREPIVDEKYRLEVVSSIRYVHEAILGDPRDPLETIVRVKPDVILLGPDQWPDEERLMRELEKRGVNARIERLSDRLECETCSVTSIACRVLRLRKFFEEACQRST